MRILLSTFFTAILLLTSSIQAFAEKKDLPANKASPILYFVVYDPLTCQSGSKPKTRISIEPEHGHVSFRWFAYKMGDSARNCKGKFSHGMLAIYTPNKGYHGQDKVKFWLIGSGVYPGASYGLSHDFSYDITVK